YLRCDPDDGGYARVTARLHADEAALLMQAIDAARAEAAEASREGTSCASAEAASHPPYPSRIDGLMRVADAFLAGGGYAPRTGGERAHILLHLAPSLLDQNSHDLTLADGSRASA